MVARTTVQPVIMNNVTPGVLPIALPSAGVDAAGAGNAFATAWGGAATGIQFYNPGNIWIWYWNGATACSAYALVGQKVGGDVFPYTQETIALATSGAGWIPPLSPSKYTQQDTSQFSGAPGGAIGSAGQGLTCVDFSATGTLAVRLYQAITVS